jgi:hypothetical protein
VLDAKMGISTYSGRSSGSGVNGQPLEKLRPGSGLLVKGQELGELLSQAGEDGWDLVSHKMPNVGTEVFVFRRAKP